MFHHAFSGSSTHNWFGDGSDGNIAINSGYNYYTVQNKNGSYDGDMYVVNAIDFYLNGGEISTDQPCRALLIYAQGDVYINGTINMVNKGPYADPTVNGGSDSSPVHSDGLCFDRIVNTGAGAISARNNRLAGCGTKALLSENKQPIITQGKRYQIYRQGANGGAAGWNGSSYSGIDGTSSSTVCQTGGGGGGNNYQGPGGAGSYGSCFGGGSGGGGCSSCGSCASATAWGGPGGAGGSCYNTGTPGAGNGGSGYTGGVGGTVIIIARKSIIFGSSGYINSRGVIHPGAGGGYSCGGGGSGGGAAILLYGDSLTNAGGRVLLDCPDTASIAYHGGYGGTGSYIADRIAQ